MNQLIAERIAERNYDDLLSFVQLILGKKITDGFQLDTNCRPLFKRKWRGIYAKNTVPIFNKGRSQYCIVNTHPDNKEGEHWVALAYRRGKIYAYDSYGRDVKTLLNLKDAIVNTDRDVEQTKTQKNCGQRCVAWLLLFNNNYKQALLI